MTNVTLRCVIRDPRSGVVHRPGEHALVMREQISLGRHQLVARFDDNTTAILFDEEIVEAG